MKTVKLSDVKTETARGLQSFILFAIAIVIFGILEMAQAQMTYNYQIAELNNIIQIENGILKDIASRPENANVKYIEEYDATSTDEHIIPRELVVNEMSDRKRFFELEYLRERMLRDKWVTEFYHTGKNIASIIAIMLLQYALAKIHTLGNTDYERGKRMRRWIKRRVLKNEEGL